MGFARPRTGNDRLLGQYHAARHRAHACTCIPTRRLSGTYYVQVPKGSPGIKFEDPRLDRFMAAPPREPARGAKLRPWVTFPAAAGQLLLFESWLRHEVAPEPRRCRANQRKLQLQLVLRTEGFVNVGQSLGCHHGGFPGPGEHRAGRARCQVPEFRHRKGARASIAQGPHRGQESLLRFRALQGFQTRPARSGIRTHRNSACEAVRQEFRRHPHGRRRAGSVLHQGPRRYLRHLERRLGFLSAGEQAARERQNRHRCRRQEFHLGSIHQQLR